MPESEADSPEISPQESSPEVQGENPAESIVGNRVGYSKAVINVGTSEPLGESSLYSLWSTDSGERISDSLRDIQTALLSNMSDRLMQGASGRDILDTETELVESHAVSEAEIHNTISSLDAADARIGESQSAIERLKEDTRQSLNQLAEAIAHL